MAKLSSASVRLVMKKNRMNRNNEFPIYIVVCYGGRVEKATGVSVKEKYWDFKREVIKNQSPNAALLNKILFDIKQKVISRRNQYELDGVSYTPSMLFNDDEVSSSSKLYSDIMKRVIADRRLKHHTVNRYNYAYNKLCEFIGKDDFEVGKINLGLIKDFIKWLNVGDSTKRDILRCVASVLNYAISVRLMDKSDYPFSNFRIGKNLKEGHRDYCIDLINIKKLKEYFLDMVIERDGDRWSYRDGALDRLHKRSSKEFGIMFLLVMFYLNGSAPTDAARIRVEDCSRVVINGEDYWKIEFKRKKTNSVVSVRLKRDMFSIIILEHFMGFSENGYVYPIFSDRVIGDDVKMDRAIHKFSESCIKWVREAFSEINEETIKSNVINGLEEPLVDVNKVVLYTARHSFASAYLNSEGATVRGAASLLSRSANTIATYIHQLQNDSEIASAVSFLDD